VSRLESHIHSSEREFMRQLQITKHVTNQELDDLFLSEDYNKASLVKDLSVTNVDESDE